MTKRIISLLSLLCLAQLLFAQIPNGYYSATKGQKGSRLKTALFHAIKDHNVCSYSSLMDHFKVTDRRADGKVWDMYSSTTNYSYRGGSARYSGEGAGFNREHSFPKSWFGGKVSPMYTDLFHIYPTDGYINNRRWHYAFGETEGEKYMSEGGWSKLGLSTIPGCNEVVFEPNDEYKGDFARTYFYMATCYEDKIAGWKYLNGKPTGDKVPMLNQTAYPCFEQWALDMLLRWAKQDPVSQKEIDRNNAVYGIQENRNPYIDFPGLEEYVWGNKTAVAFDPDNYEGAGGGEVNPQPDDKEISAPVFSVPSGEVKKGTKVTISCTTPGASIAYTINSEKEQTQLAPVEIEISANMFISAYAVLGDKQSQVTTANYRIFEEPVAGEGVYARVNSMEELTLDSRYLIVCEGKQTAMSASAGDIRKYAEVRIDAHALTTEVSAEALPYALVLGKDAQGYTFYDAADHSYLALTSNSNKLYSVSSKEADNAHWTISISAAATDIFNVAYANRKIQYNSNAPRFATYTSSQQPVELYKETVVSAIECPVMTDGWVDVYDMQGRLLRTKVNKNDALRDLPAGGYIMGGKKVIVR